jgi:hypothetical protein
MDGDTRNSSLGAPLDNGLWNGPLGAAMKPLISLNKSKSKDPFFNNVSLLLKMNGPNNGSIFTDSSLNNNVVTAVSNARTSTAITMANFEQSLSLPGDGSRINWQNSSLFAFGTGDLTVEFWVYRTTNPSFVRFIGCGSWGIEIGSGSNTKWGSPAGERILTSPPPLNQWVHVAFCRASGIIRLFYNGFLQASNTDSGDISSTTGTAYLGADNSGTFPFGGYVDELRITKGIARYISNFQTPTEPF